MRNKKSGVLNRTAFGILLIALIPTVGDAQQEKVNPDLEKPEEISGEVDREKDYWEELVEEDETIAEDQDKIPEWEARLELARLLGYQEKYKRALKQYEKVLEEKPNNTEIKMEMAQIYVYNGEAEKAYALIGDLNEGEFQTLGPKNLLIAAESYAAAGKYEKAISFFRTYLKKNPSHPRVRFELAQVLGWAKKYDEALAEYRKLLKKHPEDNQVRRHYARVLGWMGKHEKAAEEFQKSLGESE